MAWDQIWMETFKWTPRAAHTQFGILGIDDYCVVNAPKKLSETSFHVVSAKPKRDVFPHEKCILRTQVGIKNAAQQKIEFVSASTMQRY
jgi:hypothetical protein